MSLTLTSNDIIEIRKNFKLNQDVAFNVLHYRVASITGVPPNMSTSLAAIGAAAFNKFKDQWAAAASQTVNFTGVTCQDVWPLPRSVPTTYTPGAPKPGAVASDPLPLQNAPTILKKTEVGQRWGLGRYFYVGLSELDQASGIINAGSVTALNALALLLLDSLSVSGGGWSASLVPVLFARSGATARVTPITGMYLSSDVIKSQKRRRPGKGI